MNEIDALIILSQIPHLGSVKIRLLANHFGSAAAVLDASPQEIEELPGFGTKIARHWNRWESDNSWQDELELVQRHKVKLLSYKCAEYPQRLLELHDAPLLLYVKGTIKPQDQRSIAIVGTRNATRYGLGMSEKIAGELVGQGFTVISGLARGVDTAAHLGALNSHGRTLAIIGSGLLDVYPRENIKLAEKMVELGGALISEFPMKTPPDRQNFPQRNRIVSGMTMATLLIEAPIASGAMITMQRAFSQKRKLFAIPGQLDYPSFEGNHRLIKTGEALLVENGEDIAAHFQDLLGTYKKEVFKKEKVVLEKEEENLLDSIPSHELSFDEIAGITKFPAMKLNVILMGLVLKRAINEYPGKIYKKVF